VIHKGTDENIAARFGCGKTVEVYFIPLRVEEKWILLSAALLNSRAILPIEFPEGSFRP